MKNFRLTKQLPSGFVRQLKQLFALSARYFDPSDCWVYGYDNSRRQVLPSAVIFPTSHDQVLNLVRLCNEYSIAITARGRGTGTVGGAVPEAGGIVASMERMKKIVEFSPENKYIVVEPGLTNLELQNYVSAAGLFWPPDPTSAEYCSIGGNLAYNSAGPRAVKYGTPRENTLGLRIVSGAGEEIRLGVRTTKGVVGYDLTRLIIGSEGTLALITEATLKLTPIAESKVTIRAIYNSVTAAIRAVTTVMTQPQCPCALEFIDHQALKMIQGYSDIQIPELAGALLMIEMDGLKLEVEIAVEKIKKTLSTDGVIDIAIANTASETKELWKIRKALSPALRNVAPKKINEDVVVPISKIPDLIEGLEKISQKYQIKIVNFGHAGNGNIHVNLLYDPNRDDEEKRASNCLEDVFNLVLGLDGTLSGEHGVGLEKRDWVNRELGEKAISLMHGIKRQFDPNNILNPEKLPLTSQNP